LFSYRKNSSLSDELEEFVKITRTYLKDNGAMTKNNVMLYGVFEADPSIGYLFISEFSDDINITGPFNWVDSINEIIKFFRVNTQAVIVDVRYNLGGFSSIMEYIASRFAWQPENYLIISTKKGPGPNDFSAPLTYKITPAGTSYTKPVVLLTNKASCSAAEWFTLAMRRQPHVSHVGSSTSGALSTRITRPMINGWYYSISACKVTDINGKCYEGFGIQPHTEISGIEKDRWTVHPGNQLERVFSYLISKLKGLKNE
jgi:C-terminal processing protease CtpA/Prc